jgi:hypothetical protein
MMNLDLIITLILAFMMLVLSVFNEVFILWPLIVVMLLIIFIFVKRGVPLKALVNNGYFWLHANHCYFTDSKNS